jgi:hypothetical protein
MRTLKRATWWRGLAAWAGYEGSGQRDGELTSDRRDRVSDVSIRAGTGEGHARAKCLRVVARVST